MFCLRLFLMTIHVYTVWEAYCNPSVQAHVTFVCICMNEYIRNTSLWPADTQTGPLTNFVTEPVKNQEAKTGDIVRLSCTVSDGDVVHWLFNDIQISASNSTYTVIGGNLTINSFQFNQAGLYRCVASTDGGNTLQVSHAGRVWYLGKCCRVSQI